MSRAKSRIRGIEGDWDLKTGYGGKASSRYRVVAYDYGIKRNILRLLTSAGCDVTVVPATMPAEEVLAMNPDGVFLSNGPGDPEPVTYAIENIKKLLGKKPIFGICLGQQLLGLALGGRTYKLKFGHHGGNQPIMDLDNAQGRDRGGEPRLCRGPGNGEGPGCHDACEPERQYLRGYSA